jgi:hypothetical protein
VTAGEPAVPRVKLVQGGRAPWSKKKKAGLGCCAISFALLLGACIWSGSAVAGSYRRSFVAGERFYPEDPVAPENLLVVRADLSDPGFAEQAPVFLSELQKLTQDDSQLPESLRWLRDRNRSSSLNGLAIYLPVTVTTSWDDSDASPVSSSTFPIPQPPRLVVVQYRGLASFLARAMGFFFERSAGRETLEHDGTTFAASPAPPGDPDRRELVSIGDRLVVANRVSLAKGALDAAASPPLERAPDDPRHLLELLPEGREICALHRGAAAAASIGRFLEWRQAVKDARAGRSLATPSSPPELPFDASGLDALAWSITFGAGDTLRSDVVFRFKTSDDAAAAEKALRDPVGPHWTWLSDMQVPTAERASIERVSPLTVHLSVGGPGASAAVRAWGEDLRALEKARRALRRKASASIRRSLPSASPQPPK